MVGLDGPVAGVDEVGRGPLAGPVVAAAVVFGERIPEGLRDSKKLSERRREALAVEIRDAAVAYSVGRAEVDEIDSLNILNASLLAMRRAVLGLVIVPDGVLVDGNRLPELPIPALAIVGGDDRVPAISAAAILAKVTRDDEMRRLAGSYPQYGFERNKGYPTAEHLDALARLGPTPLHRRTFAPVQRALARRAGGRSGTVAPCPA